MNKTLGMLGIGLVLGGLTGFLIAAGNGVTLDGHEHGENLAGHGGHAGHGDTAGGHGSHAAMHNEMVKLEAGANAPTVGVTLHKDPDGSWNLQIHTTNFRFAPENVSKDHVVGEGHAHIYVNGKKVARHYSDWYHLGKLPVGMNKIAVTLNANDHRQLAVGDEALKVEMMHSVE